MDLIKNENLADPNVCTICEEHPNGDKVVDTARFTPFNPTYPLNGRKFICERCAKEIANTLGFQASEDVQAANVAADQARAELGNVRQRITELADHIRDIATSASSTDVSASAEALAAVIDEGTPAAAALKASKTK